MQLSTDEYCLSKAIDRRSTTTSIETSVCLSLSTVSN